MELIPAEDRLKGQVVEILCDSQVEYSVHLNHQHSIGLPRR